MPRLHELLCAKEVLPRYVDVAFVRQRYQLFRANLVALEAYVPAPYPGPVVLLHAGRLTARTAAWRDVVRGPYGEYEVPGDHYSMWSPENAPVVPQVLEDLLA